MIYIVCFLLSMFFAGLAQNAYKKSKVIGNLFSAIAILIPSILAGIRTTDIGIDVDVYVNNNFMWATHHTSLFVFVSRVNSDFLYLALNFFVSRFTNNLNIFLFIVQLINTVLVYLYIYSKKDNHSMAMMYAIYLFIFYNSSLNLVRQSLALSTVIFSFKYVDSKQKFKYYLTNFIAILFHSSAIVALPIYYLANMKDSKNNKYFKLIIIIGLMLGVVLYKDILILFINLGILPSKYMAYLGLYARTSLNLNLAASGFCLIWIIIFFLVSKKDETNNSYRNYFMIIGLIFIQLSSFVEFADRVSYYFIIPCYMLGDKSIEYFFVKSKNSSFAAKVLLMSLLLFYWYFTFVHFNTGETIPYVSIFD